MSAKMTAAQRRNEQTLRERDLKLIQTDIQLAMLKMLPADGSESAMFGDFAALVNPDTATAARYRATVALEARGLVRRIWMRNTFSLTRAGMRLRDGELPDTLPPLTREQALALIADLPSFDGPGGYPGYDGDDYTTGYGAGYECAAQDIEAWIRDVLSRVPDWSNDPDGSSSDA